MPKRVLVTGASGFIGSHLAEALLKRGYEVWALVRRGSRRRWLPEGVKVWEGSLNEVPSLPPDLHHLFHLAGLTRARRPREFFIVNAEGTRRLLLVLKEGGGIGGRFIYLSSLAAAGPCRPDLPRREDDPPQPVSPYGRSKLEGERHVLEFKDAFSVTILRPSAVYGPRDDYMWEYFRTVAKGVFPVLGGKERWISLCYVGDLVEAIILAAEVPHPSGEIFFISDGQRYPLHFVTDMVASLLGRRVRRIRVPEVVARIVAWASEGWGRLRGRAVPFNRNKCMEALQEAWLCDIGKAREILKFSPRYPLKEGLRITLQWYKREGWL